MEQLTSPVKWSENTEWSESSTHKKVQNFSSPISIQTTAQKQFNSIHICWAEHKNGSCCLSPPCHGYGQPHKQGREVETKWTVFPPIHTFLVVVFSFCVCVWFVQFCSGVLLYQKYNIYHLDCQKIIFFIFKRLLGKVSYFAYTNSTNRVNVRNVSCSV